METRRLWARTISNWCKALAQAGVVISKRTGLFGGAGGCFGYWQGRFESVALRPLGAVCVPVRSLLVIALSTNTSRTNYTDFAPIDA
jgi:hypothetical protein